MKRLLMLLNSLWFLGIGVGTSLSYADWGHHDHAGYHGIHHYYRYHEHPHYGIHVTAFYPEEYYPIWVGGSRYYYDDGVYYSYVGGNYVVAPPPAGAIVTTIPSDFKQVVINGVTYYTDNGTYYIYTSSGYKVVPEPQSENAFVLHVPSDRGGYVTVTLRKSGDGFVGPQGEFYAQFPRISQLQVMYGK